MEEMRMSKIDDKYFWFLGSNKDPLKPDKNAMANLYKKEFALRCQQIFEYENLPKTLPKWALELIVQTKGQALVAKYKDDLYVYQGGWGGEPNEYYRPTQFIVANPYQKYNKTFTIGKDSVLWQNDDLCMGLEPLWDRASQAITDTDVTIKIATVMSRMQSIISATDDSTYESAVKYLEKLEKGELGAIMDEGLVPSLHTSPYANSSTSTILTQLMELRTYQLNTFYNEIGIQASTNQKRENVSELESSQNRDYLLPLVQNMLTCRERAVKETNEMFGTEIKVSFSDMWKTMEEDIEEGSVEDED